MAIAHWATATTTATNMFKKKTVFTVLIIQSRTLMAKAVPHANGWDTYNSLPGSSSSSWSKNWTLLSTPFINFFEF